jgi:hypothetical protein
MTHTWALLLLLLSVTLTAAEKPKAYTTKYDNVDVDSILSNTRILTSYIKCMLDEGPCTPDARELKSEYRLWQWYPTGGTRKHPKILFFVI